MNILVIGDIVGRPGRKAIRELLPQIQKDYKIVFTIANAENAAGGRGLSREVMKELLSHNIDVLTMGNHVWDNKEILNFIDDEHRLIRPANYPPYCPGQGYHIYIPPHLIKRLWLMLRGEFFLPSLDCPFRVVDEIVSRYRKNQT